MNAPTEDHADTSGPNLAHLRRAVELALAAERAGNLPIGACITLDDEVVAEGGNAVLVPVYHPGRHAEIEALARVPLTLWPHARRMTCYTTLEPCVMCAGALVLHGVGRVVFGAVDPEGGAGKTLLANLPDYYAGGAGAPVWLGPLMPDECEALYRRARLRFDALPCGRDNF